MKISNSLLAHGLTVGAAVLVAAGAAIAAPSPDTIAPAIATGLTALSGALLALKLTRAATVASELLPALPVLVKVGAALEPLVVKEWAAHHSVVVTNSAEGPPTVLHVLPTGTAEAVAATPSVKP